MKHRDAADHYRLLPKTAKADRTIKSERIRVRTLRMRCHIILGDGAGFFKQRRSVFSPNHPTQIILLKSSPLKSHPPKALSLSPFLHFASPYPINPRLFALTCEGHPEGDEPKPSRSNRWCDSCHREKQHHPALFPIYSLPSRR